VDSDSWEGRDRLIPSLTLVQEEPLWIFLGNVARNCNSGSLWKLDTWQFLPDITLNEAC
jgi:hypothetical protein